ncbi:MAG: hypothetical protein NC548_64445 [Lachnospiraceae bacterium]|nr:hypothetical protein [Lachnospiraceae bacterium]MCM1244639.1 hypothetical protein [Roseburia sp.]
MEQKEKIRRIVMLALAGVMVLILIFGKNENQPEENSTNVEKVPQTTATNTGTAILTAPEPTENPEDNVYSFLQGPKSWKERRPWSGKWGKEYHDGSSFGAFGCGFCCMANIYSTTTEYKCSPLDIYEYSKKKTLYGGGGAISWQLMRKTMTDIGFSVELGEKPSTYAQFRETASQSQALLVLVSSYDDDSYWKNTPGHYVTLFLYDDGVQDAFLTDSGDPKHNRQRIPLKTIYKALKTSSDFQYMSVLSYDEKQDNWKHKEINGTWVRPESGVD